MDQKPDPKLRINFEYFIFEKHSVSQGGFLPDFERGAHACWYYCICAHQNLQAVQDGAVLEGERDSLPALNNIARSVAMQYQLDDPDQFLVFMPLVMKEAMRVGMSWDFRVLSPGNERFQHVM